MVTHTQWLAGEACKVPARKTHLWLSNAHPANSAVATGKPPAASSKTSNGNNLSEKERLYRQTPAYDYTNPSEEMIRNAHHFTVDCDTGLLYHIEEYQVHKKDLAGEHSQQFQRPMRLVVPHSIRSALVVMYHYHLAHCSARKCYEMLRTRYWWKNMRSSITTILSTCIA